MSSNIPVRRGLRTRATARNIENATARTTRPATRSKTVAAASATASALPSGAATKVKSTAPENKAPTAAVKTRRGALLEVTKLVTNNDPKGKPTATLKGKEKETAPPPGQSKPVLVDVRKPLQKTTTTRTATRRTTRSAVATTSTTRQPIARPVDKAANLEAPKQTLLQRVEETRPSAQTALAAPTSTLRKRTSNLADQTEAPRVFKRPHTEQKEVLPPLPSLPDDSQEEADKVAADLMQQDADFEPVPKGQLWTDLDADDWEDPLMATEYVLEICDYWKRIEVEMLPDPDYFRRQPHVTWQHRGILINWIMEIHSRFRLLQETLFLSVNILDRLLSIRVVSLQKLQLVGAACLLIACKYEETCSPSVAEMVHLCDDQFKPEEIVRAEQYVLKAINWNLSFPGPMGWLRRGSKADDYEEKARTISKYLLEIGCLDRHLIAMPPSLTAAASLWFARLILGREEWTANLSHYATYTEDEIVPIANYMLNYILQPTVFPMVYKKYASKRFLKCSVYLKNWSRQRWAEGTNVELEKHVQWLKADVRTMRERLATESVPVDEASSTIFK